MNVLDSRDPRDEAVIRHNQAEEKRRNQERENMIETLSSFLEGHITFHEDHYNSLTTDMENNDTIGKVFQSCITQKYGSISTRKFMKEIYPYIKDFSIDYLEVSKSRDELIHLKANNEFTEILRDGICEIEAMVARTNSGGLQEIRNGVKGRTEENIGNRD